MRSFIKCFGIVSVGLFLFVGSSVISSTAHAKKDGVIRIGPVKIEGKIQKPQAFYVLGRAPLNYKNLNLKTSFLDKVVMAVKKAPF